MQLIFVSSFSVSVLESTRNKHLCCLVGSSSQYMTYSTMEIVNETQSINLSDIYMTATVSSETNYTSSVLGSENSASISATPPLPSNCYRVCVCNHSTGKYRQCLCIFLPFKDICNWKQGIFTSPQKEEENICNSWRKSLEMSLENSCVLCTGA